MNTVKDRERFKGNYFRGKGDVEYLELLDIARGLFDPNPEFQNLPMLYTPTWNGFVEGPTWPAWWIQNSYGPTYCALPFYKEPLITFLQNSQDLWFDQIGDGRRADRKGYVAPDGCLCDAASPDFIDYKQGDGQVDIHDWGMEFTAAGLLLQAELLLISRDSEAVVKYLPKLERCAGFIETRRDPKNNLFLAGPAGNLLAPSYAGCKLPNGTYGQAYLAGLSITYIAALDRLIEVEKLAGNNEKVALYVFCREQARRGLHLLTTREGYFLKSLDPDGTSHGIYGASRHGYFEAPPNHDAIAFRVVDDAQAAKIYRKIASITALRPYDFIITNYPSLDDMYGDPVQGGKLWEFGECINGAHWSTCEARMIIAYYRLGKYNDARRSMQRFLGFARSFRMDNPLPKFGSDVYQPDESINLCYDSFGPPAAMIRGLFEYLYHADGLTLVPHIPSGITELVQCFPIRFGKSKLYISTIGEGEISYVWINGKQWDSFDANSVFLPADKIFDTTYICISLGRVVPSKFSDETTTSLSFSPNANVPTQGNIENIGDRTLKLRRLLKKFAKAGLEDSYEAKHAKLALRCFEVSCIRRKLIEDGKLQLLPPESQVAADKSYLDTAVLLYDGLEKVLKSCGNSVNVSNKRRI